MANEILTSLHGGRIGLDKDDNLIIPKGRGFVQRNIVSTFSETVTVTSAQLLALNATPKTILAAPGTGKALIFNKAVIHKPAGTAYAGIAAGEDLVFKYTDGSGAQVSSVIETTGFLDSTSALTRTVGKPASTGSTAGDVAVVTNAAIVLHLLVGEIITGTSPLYVTTWYDVIDFALGA